MTNVVALPGVDIPASQSEVNAHIVKMCEALLERARSGHLRAIAYCTYDSAGMIGNGWVKGKEGLSLGAALMALHHRFAESTWPTQSADDAIAVERNPNPGDDAS